MSSHMVVVGGGRGSPPTWRDLEGLSFLTQTPHHKWPLTLPENVEVALQFPLGKQLKFISKLLVLHL